MAYIGNSPANVGNYQIIDDIKSQFDGTTTSFQLQVATHNITPAKSGQLLVSINGVLQEPDDTGTQGFTISGTNIVFSSAPNTGAEFWGVYQGQNVDIGTPSLDTVDTVHIKDDAITDVKINSTTLNGKFNKSGDTMSGHIHFDTDATYDIGSSEYKVRHMFVSENSLWIGDTHKISIESGKMKFRKRKTSSVPTGVSTAGGNSTAALLHASKGSLELMTSADWLSYRRTFNPDAKITDVFDAADFDDEDDIATVNGLQAALDAKLDDSQVLTNVPAGALFTDTNTETTTSISINANVLTYTDEVGVDTDIDLSLYIDDSNLARLTSGTIDSGTGIATFSRDDASTFTVDFSALLDDTILTDADIGAMGYIKTDNDTIYTHPATHPASMLTGALPAIDGSNLNYIKIKSDTRTAATAGAGALRWETGVLENSDGTEWLKISSVPATLTSASGTLYSGKTSTLTLNGGGFLTAGLVVNFKQTSDSINVNVSVTPTSDTEASVTVPNSVYNNVTIGNDIAISVTNSDGSSSGTVTKTATAMLGASSGNAAANATALLNDGQTTNGYYYINLGSGAQSIYCILDGSIESGYGYMRVWDAGPGGANSTIHHFNTNETDNAAFYNTGGWGFTISEIALRTRGTWSQGPGYSSSTITRYTGNGGSGGIHTNYSTKTFNTIFSSGWVHTGFETDNYKNFGYSHSTVQNQLYVIDDNDTPCGRQTGCAGTPKGLVSFGYSNSSNWPDHGTNVYDRDMIVMGLYLR